MRPRRPAKISIVLALLGAIALLPPQGWALCVEADGHVAVEARCDGERSSAVPASGAPGDDCGPCVDVVIAVDVQISPAKNLRQLVRDSAPALALPTSSPIAYATLEARVTAPPRAGLAAPAPLPQRAILLI